MKKAIAFISILFIFTGYIFAQDDEVVPFLTESDITAIETVLPEDTDFRFQDEVPALTPGGKTENEISRLNASHPVYHLLILDRVYCPNSDIAAAENMQVLYKYRHGRNGFLIAVYVSPVDGPVFPELPVRSRIIVNMSSIRRNTLLEYINSTAFRRFVTNRTILTQLRAALR